MKQRLLRRLARAALPWLVLPAAVAAGTLEAQRAAAGCGAPPVAGPMPPAAALQRLPGSQAVSGSRNIAWAWLGTPASDQPQAPPGPTVHARSLHALVTQPGGTQRVLAVTLPPGRAFEDRLLRLADLEGDGGEQIVAVESDRQRGSVLVVYGLRTGAGSRQPVLATLARGPFSGAPLRGLDPLGVADFDGDGRPDLAAVTAQPGGVLTLYRYAPPRLEPFASLPGLSSHRDGSAEQPLSAIVHRPPQRPALIVAGSDLRTLQALHLDQAGRWQAAAGPLVLPAPVQRLMPLPAGACALMTDGSSLRLRLAG